MNICSESTDFRRYAELYPEDARLAHVRATRIGLRSARKQFRQHFRANAGWTDRTGGLRRSIRAGRERSFNTSRKAKRPFTILTWVRYGYVESFGSPRTGQRSAQAGPLESSKGYMRRALSSFDTSRLTDRARQALAGELAKLERKRYPMRRYK